MDTLIIALLLFLHGALFLLFGLFLWSVSKILDGED